MSFNSNIHSKSFTSDILPQSQSFLQSNFATARIKTPSPLQSISYKQAHKLTRSQLEMVWLDGSWVFAFVDIGNVFMGLV